jgi:hypothetical protein
MKKEKGIFDYIIILIFILSFLGFLRCTSVNYNGSLLFLSIIAIVVTFLFLIPLSESFKKIKNSTLSMWDKIFLIIRAMVSAIVGVFLYNFILYDYSYWLSNKIFLTQLAIFSLSFIIFSYVVNLIKIFREKKENSDSNFKLIGTFLLILLNLYLVTIPFLNYCSPKKEVTLPVVKTPKSITIYLENTNGENDPFTIGKSVEITNVEAIGSICNVFSHATIENLINLDSLKFELTKMEKSHYYNLVPNYDVSNVNTHPSTLVDFKNGYLPYMYMLPDGETSIIVLDDDFYDKHTFNPFKPIKFGELYKIKLPKETVNYIIEAAKK